MNITTNSNVKLSSKQASLNGKNHNTNTQWTKLLEAPWTSMKALRKRSCHEGCKLEAPGGAKHHVIAGSKFHWPIFRLLDPTWSQLSRSSNHKTVRCLIERSCGFSNLRDQGSFYNHSQLIDVLAWLPDFIEILQFQHPVLRLPEILRKTSVCKVLRGHGHVAVPVP